MQLFVNHASHILSQTSTQAVFVKFVSKTLNGKKTDSITKKAA